MISLRSFRDFPSRLLGAVVCVWLCAAGASIVACPALAQDQAAPPTAAPAPQTQKKDTQTDLTASSSTSKVGSAVTFTAVVTGAGGVPVGTVTFKDGEIVLDSAELSEGRARWTVSALAAGRRTIVVTYSGDATFEGSVSAALSHEVVKAATAIELIELAASATEGEAGQRVTFKMAVSGTGGTPTGTVTLKAGDVVLGSVALTEGRASLTTSALAAGRHTITATYGGDAAFGPSTSEPRIYRIRQAAGRPENLPAVLVLLAALLAAFIILALLALFRKLASRWLLRPLSSWTKALSRAVRRVLRFGRQAPTRERPLKSLLGQSVGGMVFTETEDEIAKDFDKSSVRINRKFRLGCSWIHPVLVAEHNREGAKEAPDSADEASGNTKEDVDKDKEDFEKARADFEKARQLFRADVPTDTNPLNLYEDIHNAFIAKLFSRSDKPCFYVLSEFGRVISSNVFCLAIVFSCVATAVAFINIVASGLVPFHLLLKNLPTELTFLGIDMSAFLRTVGDFSSGFDKFVFTALSCLLGFVVMLMFYQLAYQQLQTLNGQQMDIF
ncbi:MAG: Ig-like domain-containing protein, partial [Hyphomicrobiaceae bacterium]